ncbi:pfkB family kinase [Penicillium chermesinum]|uniref:PfkB family kinase n=1 Tax=Penicillium chermesinum TaxID=63820 RepID=A0A9W9TS57_9EURO|nr:pfkB family kinase [Penicillium chermesinum]KAJ5239395.1 pfkB family kinase [Penicillium chermesinum]KAJ6141346.1 pfkB family kinase [Penicillium chermesinum]
MTLAGLFYVALGGEDGAAAFEPQRGHLIHEPAYTKDNFEVVDPVGAGDTFIAGMLYALNCHKWNLTQRLKFANRVAAMKVSQEGFSGLARALQPENIHN